MELTARGDRAMTDIAWRAVALSPLAEVLAAVGFLTRIPVAVPGPGVRTGAAAFGLVGLGLGIVAAAPLVVLGPGHAWLAAILGVATLAVVDGGLHLDGLADTADALSAPAGAAERARTDPRAGSAGVVAMVLVLGLQTAALAEVAAREMALATGAMVVAVTLSRAVAPVWAVTVGATFGPPDGLGRWFAQNTGAGAAILCGATGVAAAAAVVAFVGPGLLLGSVAGLAMAATIGLVVIRLRGQLDGDGYGALIEVTGASILVAAAMLA